MTFLQPNRANKPARTSMMMNTMRNAAQRCNQMFSTSATKKKKKNELYSAIMPATPNRPPPQTPFFTSVAISALANSTSARTRLDIWAVASLTRSPMDPFSAVYASESVKGMEFARGA